ncbi:MAG: hypothetical protein ACOYKZ_02705 [Chlamydiia bacterium]
MRWIKALCMLALAWSSAQGMAGAWSSDAWLNLMVARDSLRWRIPEPLTDDYCVDGDAVISELCWKPLRCIGFDLGIRTPFGHPKFMVILQGQVAAICGGHCRDSDWLGPNFCLEVSRSLSQASGWTASGQAMLGYRLGSQAASIAPVAGLDAARIRLRQRGLRQLFNLDTEDLTLYTDEEDVLTVIKGEVYAMVRPDETHSGPVSSYDIDWIGGLLGGEIYLQPCASMKLQLLGWASLGKYDADADWILRECYQHPRSFAHSAQVRTWALEGGIYWQMTSRLGLNLRGGARQVWATEGCERIFLDRQDDMDEQTLLLSSFQDLTWKRGWVSAGLLFIW